MPPAGGASLFNPNVLGRSGTCGNASTAIATFGAPGMGIANLDPARQVQLQARFTF